MKFHFITTGLFVLGFASLMAQPISNEGTLFLDCDNTLNMTDSDANGGNYAAGENYTITICPDGGNTLTFSTSAEDGGFFDLAPGDMLFVYDGDDTSGPLLGTYDSTDNDLGFVVTSTVENNPTGCLTFVFISAAGSPTATGWSSLVFCGLSPLPFEVNIQAKPEDIDGYIDICQGETITFLANTNYLYDGQGYSQDDNTSYFLWEIPDGTTYEGTGLTTITHTFPDSFGYLIELTVTDGNGLSIQHAEIKVRVSTTPSFAGVLSAFEDTICVGNTSTLVGGINTDTTVTFGVLANPSAFIGGGFFGELLFLPDGGAVNNPPDLYETVIEIDDFPPGAQIENPSDIVAICVTMEHSFMGDLELWVECPNGTQVVLFDAYTGQGSGPGIIPGGFTGGGNFLGEPVDPGSEPGIGYTYCFTPTSTQFGSFEDEFNAGTLGSPVEAGDYLPMGNFADFVGCDINGEWTLGAADNWFADDGYIFNWSIIFDPTIDPNVENYAPLLVDIWWDDDPTIILNNDTLIEVKPNAPGSYDYTVNVLDNFGCEYDTTVTVHVLPEPSVLFESPACYNETEIDVTNIYQNGWWDYEASSDTLIALVIPSANGDHVDITVNLPGYYTFIYNDIFCQRDYQAEVFFAPPPLSDLPDTVIVCLGDEYFYGLTDQPDGIDYTWAWSLPGPSASASESILAENVGQYTLIVQSETCPDDLAFSQSWFEFKNCEISTYNVFTPNGDNVNDVFYIQGIEEHPGARLEVYNRWGNVIFEEINYRNDWEMDDLNEGTYYFVLILKNGENHTGSFTLLRDN